MKTKVVKLFVRIILAVLAVAVVCFTVIGIGCTIMWLYPDYPTTPTFRHTSFIECPFDCSYCKDSIRTKTVIGELVE